MIDLTITLRVPMAATSFPVVDAMGEEIAAVLTRYYGTGVDVRYLSGHANTSPPAPRIVTRRGKYRNPMTPGPQKEGFIIRAYDKASGTCRSSIFTETETSAAKIRARLLGGEEVRTFDFLP